MIKNFITLLIILSLTCLYWSISMAEETDKQKGSWDELYVKSLTDIKNPQKTEGLGYTLSDEEALQKAIKTAMEQKAPACQALKIAVDMKFNPYEVLSGIFNSGAKIDLEQLCLCATETGDSSISKSVMMQAANDAVAANRIRRDEVTQAQCLQQGLGFTLAQNTPDPINPEPRQPNYSPY